MDSSQTEFELKVIVVGDTNVGKSALLKRLTGDGGNEEIKPTIGLELYSAVRKTFLRNVKLQLWDTGGQERFRTLIPRYYDSAHVILAVFDLTSRDSFVSLESWMLELRRYGSRAHAVVLIENKKDLAKDRQVSAEEILQFKTRHGCSGHFHLSARESKSMAALMDKIVRKGVKIEQKRREELRLEEEMSRRNWDSKVADEEKNCHSFLFKSSNN